LILLLALAVPAFASGSESKPKPKSSKADMSPKTSLPLSKYLTLAPFVVPLARGNEMIGQYTLVLALEMEQPDTRDEIRQYLAPFRNEVYALLFQSVTARSSGGQVPGLDHLTGRLLKIAHASAGPELVRSVVIQEAYAGPLPNSAAPAGVE
jgi:hypothetical protein